MPAQLQCSHSGMWEPGNEAMNYFVLSRSLVMQHMEPQLVFCSKSIHDRDDI